VELEQSQKELEQQGLGVAVISYDSPQVISHFANRLGISVSMLSDEKSSMIRAFGILNTNVPEGHSRHGMSFPGTYIVDEKGVVVSKYFQESHRQRYTADTILLKEYDVGGWHRMEARTEHLTLTAYASQETVRRGNRITLVLEGELSPKMHVYAPGVQGYLPVDFSIEESWYLKAHPPEFSKSEILYLAAIQERVPVYQGTFKVTRDITISPKLREESSLEIAAVFKYQACDDQICYIPAKIPLTFTMTMQEHDDEKVPEAMRRKGYDR
jgi:hypothetical protein